MPITLNHSNIGVQYSTGSNYIIETVKSDLYLMNNIIDDNIQVSTVKPIIYIENGTNNVYAVESYTYTGTANTIDYLRFFPKNTTCDILIVGGGGGGGGSMGGGGGGGSVIYATNISVQTGTYSISVGKGGTGGVNQTDGTNGVNTTAFGATAIGGGRGGDYDVSNSKLSGGSGGGEGGGTNNSQAGVGVAALKGTNTIPNTSPLFTNYQYYVNDGGLALYQTAANNQRSRGGGGGGAGGAGGAGGGSSTDTATQGVGGNGVPISISGTAVYYGAGGGGGAHRGNLSEMLGKSGGLGGGGNGGSEFTNSSKTNGTDGTGYGAGGGGGSYQYTGGNGGSGIVIIRYLVCTIPTNNYLTNEPIFLSPTITSNLFIFKHSGGAEAQTTHTITIGQNTICDILIVGGGGAGGGRQGGGGGAGGVMFLENQQLSPGNYTIKVGKGGIISGTANDSSTNVIGDNGKDSEFSTFIAYGGSGGEGFGTTKADFNITTNRFASGGGATGWFNEGAQFEGWHNANERINQTNPSVQGGSSYKGGRGWQDISGEPSSFISALVGGGGGGAGGLGQDATPNNNTNYTGKAGNGGVGLNYGAVFGTMVGANGWFGGGGGGAGYSSSTDIAGTGGTGGGGGGNTGSPGIAGTNGTGGGGGGGGFPNQIGGIGGSGIVIVRMRTLNVITPVTEGFYKKMDFKFTPNYPEIAADKTTNLVAWYKFDEMSVDEGYLDSNPSNIKHNLIKPSGSTPIFTSTINISGTAAGEQGTVSHLQFPTSLTNQLYTINDTNGITFSLWYNYSNNTPDWGSFFEFSQNSTDSGTNNRFGLTKYGLENKVELFMKSPTGVFNNFDFGTNTLDNNWHHLSWSISSSGQWTVYLDGVNQNTTQNKKIANNTYNTSHIFWHVYNGNTAQVFGYIEDFRIYNYVLSAAEIATLYNINSVPKTDTYSLNFPVPTIADINNNSNIVLRGDYDIALSTSNSVIIPKAGQYIPKPTTFINYSVERMYPPVRNFTAATTAVSGQTYGNGTYVVSFSSTGGASVDPWTCFNTTSTVGGHWATGRYTAGVFNNTSFIVAGYLGDWVKIQLPVAIKLTRFNFVSRPTYQVRSPKDFKIYGSNDNITWVELVNKTDAAYNASNIYEQTTPEITNTYTYYGLVVNKIFTGTNDNTLNFDEWYIYGTEVLTSSLSLRYNLLNPILDPIGAQWTYSSNNTNVYHMGSVGIGTTSPEYNLDVRGAIYSSVGGYTQTGLTTWSITSDRRIKENITRASYDICLENVKNIELYNFNFKNNCVNTNDKHQLGFIAQEVQQVYPKAVEVGKMILNTNEAISDILTLNTTQIDYTLYGAVKNLIEKIEDIDNDLESIEKLI
jgi:hypothetical protein